MKEKVKKKKLKIENFKCRIFLTNSNNFPKIIKFRKPVLFITLNINLYPMSEKYYFFSD